MNSQFSNSQQKENCPGYKMLSSQYFNQKQKDFRSSTIHDKRRAQQDKMIYDTELKDIITKLEGIAQHLNTTTRLKSSESKEVKTTLTEIKKQASQRQECFKILINSDELAVVIRQVLENPDFATDLKFEGLSLICLSSNLKIDEEKTIGYMKSIIQLCNQALNLQRGVQIQFLQKIFVSFTNFIIDNASLAEYVQYDGIVHKHAITLIDDSNLSNITLGLWFVRNLLRHTKSGFEDMIEEKTFDRSFQALIKKFSQNKQLMTEVVWTMAHVSQICTEYEIFGAEVCSLMMEVGIHYGENLLLPVITALGNNILTISQQSLEKLLCNEKLDAILSKGLTTQNCLLNRETLFLIANLGGRSVDSARYIVNKNDLMQYLLNNIYDKTPIIYKECMFVMYNLQYVGGQQSAEFMRDNFIDGKKLYTVLNEKTMDPEVADLQNKLMKAFC